MNLVSSYVSQYKKLSTVWKIIQNVSWSVILICWSMYISDQAYGSKSSVQSVKSFHVPNEISSTELVQAAWVFTSWVMSNTSWGGINISIPTKKYCNIPFCEQILKICLESKNSINECMSLYIHFNNK